VDFGADDWDVLKYKNVSLPHAVECKGKSLTGCEGARSSKGVSQTSFIVSHQYSSNVVSLAPARTNAYVVRIDLRFSNRKCRGPLSGEGAGWAVSDAER